MRFPKIKTLLGGLPVLLAILACSVVSPAMPTLATLPPVTAVTAAAETSTQIPATVTPTLPAATETAAPAPLPTARSLASAAAPSIQLLDMLDANAGWALTDTGVVRTEDGGAHWFNVTPAGLNGAPASPCFLNATTAWLAAMGSDPTTGSLYHTTDGGVTWTSTTVPFGGGSLKFIDPLNGWELIGLSAGMSHEAVAIYRTSDGGTSWSKVFTNDPGAPSSSESLPLVGDKNGINVLDNQHAWVTGAEPADNFIFIYASQDGGATWAHQDLAIPATFSGAMTGPNLPVFFGPNQAVLPVLMFANNNGSVFYVSQDGGQSWTATTPVSQGGFLAVASATDFFVWDGSAPLNASHNAGASWTAVTPNINIKDSMASMQFVNASTGWVVTSDASNHRTLYKTTDGGSTWTILVP
jgi:photosystem II stability/assembly factor-like uncharacterized protein